jgi:hypothetical protein
VSRLPDKPPSREQLLGRLLVNAATKPVNVAVPAAVTVAGLVLGVSWLIGIAVMVYVVLAALTFFDAGEAEQVAASRRQATLGRTGAQDTDAHVTDPQIRARLDAALREEQLLRAAIADSDLALTDLSGEVDGLVGSLRTIARRAQKLAAYLASTDGAALRRRVAELERGGREPELLAALSGQAETLERMRGQLDRFEAQMEHATAVLATMRGQVVTMSVQADGFAERQLSEQARDLADQVAASAQAMDELAATAD